MRIKTLKNFSPRIRFNWGYHDGTLSAKECWQSKIDHFDQYYFSGYQKGRRDYQELGYRPETSNKAWREFKAEGE